MSKPALGRGLASLLQEETDRGAVNAPGLTPLKEAPVAQPTPALEGVSAATPIASPTQVPTEVPAPKPIPAAPAHSADQPVSEQEIALTQTVSAEATKPFLAAPVSGGGIGAVGVSNPPTPTSASATVPVVATIPSWIIPALIAGDLVVVLSAILWAAWGRGMGRWPWIAALFAVGCTQAIAALFLARSGTSQGPGPFSGRPPAAAGQAPGIRVRFVEEQPQSRRGDRR